jgi:hypothetical protein
VALAGPLNLPGAVLLGSESRPNAATLYVPPEYVDQPAAYRCHICGSEFPETQARVWQKHVGDCARAHMSEIQASTPRARAKGGPFDPETWDPELDEHMREVGRRMLREGRMEVLPHERAT